MCRKPIDCQDINTIAYSKYKYYKNLYKQFKKDIKNLQKQSYLFTLKFSIRKLVTNISPQEAYSYLMEDETFLELISNKKQELYESEKTMTMYKNLYYRKCVCCINKIH